MAARLLQAKTMAPRGKFKTKNKMSSTSSKVSQF